VIRENSMLTSNKKAWKSSNRLDSKII
jgi:hypothetical protein